MCEIRFSVTRDFYFSVADHVCGRLVSLQIVIGNSETKDT